MNDREYTATDGDGIYDGGYPETGGGTIVDGPEVAGVSPVSVAGFVTMGAVIGVIVTGIYCVCGRKKKAANEQNQNVQNQLEQANETNDFVSNNHYTEEYMKNIGTFMEMMDKEIDKDIFVLSDSFIYKQVNETDIDAGIELTGNIMYGSDYMIAA